MAVSFATFDTLLSQTHRLYQVGKYAQALDLITREGCAFPERAQTWYYWRVCLESARAIDYKETS